MIYYPIETLVKASISEILIITTSAQQPAFKGYLADGSSLNCKITYAIQDEPKGIVEALVIGKEFIGNDAVCLITGDTIIYRETLSQQLQKAFKAVEKSGNATIFVSKDTDADQYGKVVRNKTIAGESDDYYYKSITGLYELQKSRLNRTFKTRTSRNHSRQQTVSGGQQTSDSRTNTRLRVVGHQYV